MSYVNRKCPFTVFYTSNHDANCYTDEVARFTNSSDAMRFARSVGPSEVAGKDGLIGQFDSQGNATKEFAHLDTVDSPYFRAA